MESNFYDVAVIGGGAIGLAVARQLVHNGVPTVVVAPADGARLHGASVAAGAMQGAFGEVTAANRDSVTTDFCIQSQKGFPTWVADIADEAETEIHTTAGTFVVANAQVPEDLDNLSAIESRLQQAGEPYEQVAPRDVPGLAPHASVAMARALFLQREGTVDSGHLITALRTLLAKSPLARLVDSTAERIDEAGTGTYSIRAADGTAVVTRSVVVAAGAHTMPLVTHLIPETCSALRGFVGQGVAFVADNGLGLKHTLRTPNRSGACGLHVVPCANGRLYVGATNRPRLLEGAATGPMAEHLHYLLHAVIHEVNTRFSKMPVRELRFGLRPVSGDNMPLVGATEREGIYLATGTHRTGIVMSPDIARIVANTVTCQTEPENPFAITPQRIEDVRARDHVKLVRERIAEALDDMFIHPDGRLPYDRKDGLVRLIESLFDLAFTENGDRRDELVGLMNSYPDFAAMSLLNRAIQEA